jgi:hypothetical protein
MAKAIKDPDDPLEDLWQRIRLLEHRNEYLRQQNGLLLEAIDTICFAFLNNSRNLDAAIQTAMALQVKARLPPDSQIQPKADTGKKRRGGTS